MGFKNSIDISGKKFGKLMAIEKTEKRIAKHVVWKFICDCGNEHFAVASEVKIGRTKSCGCLVSENVSKANKTHGATINYKRSGIYNIWLGMMSRCNNKNSKMYKNYGGRGIKVCDRWAKFENFMIDMGERPSGCSIDRIDNNKGYYPENCKWSTKKEQARNRRTNRLLELNGQIKCMQEWADEYKIDQATLFCRLKKMSLYEALTKPVKNYNSA